MGAVKDFMNSRAASPTPGKWCASFSACKNYAIQNNIPLITAWISDDGCGYCRRFAEASTSAKFKNWMKTTGYIFWLGCEYCKGEDGEYGAGYKWCYGIAGSGGHYPRRSIYWESNGKVNDNKFRNGDILAGETLGKDTVNKQAQKNIDVFSNLLKDFQPTPPEPPKYSITFNPNGGTLTSGITKTVTQNTAIGELPIPVRSGWTFNGWFTAMSGGTQINIATVVTANATYYAHWTEIQITSFTPDPGQPQPPPMPGQPLKTMFGLCRDCTIITKDNKILQYSAAAQKITLIGDYNPNEFLAISTKIT